jgi:poly-D-alanine transfer protein DltD
VNQDGSIDTRDYIGVDNDSYNYVTGYIVTDVDCNGVIDTRDFIYIDNNNYNYVGAVHP